MLLVFLCLLPVLVSGKSTIHRPVLTTPCAAHVGPDVNDASAVVFVALEKRFIVSDQRYLYVFDTAGTQLKKSASYVTCKGVSEGESLTLVDRCVGHSQTPAYCGALLSGDSIGCPCIACPREGALFGGAGALSSSDKNFTKSRAIPDGDARPGCSTPCASHSMAPYHCCVAPRASRLAPPARTHT